MLFDDNANEVTFTTGFGGSMHFDFLSGGWDYTARRIRKTCSQHLSSTSPTLLWTATSDQTPAAALSNITVPPRPPGSLTVPSLAADEGNLAVIEINLSNAAFGDVVLSLAFANGTAEGTDYDSVSYQSSPPITPTGARS